MLLDLKQQVEPEAAVVATGVASEQDAKDEIRKTEIRWIYLANHPQVLQVVNDIASAFAPQLQVHEPLCVDHDAVQIGTYYPGHFYQWHIDGHPNEPSRRLVSASVLLSDDFTGGRMEFKTPGAPAIRKAGDIVLFHSFEEHRVQPVRKGVRDSLVIWWTAA
ncbi:MAG: 2OG-Fe(II) oxygenase [Alphaproteobacteria bacterium]|nr:2OG-Fe(II) oxygenase [Alphaproteobacteria bacterium]